MVVKDERRTRVARELSALGLVAFSLYLLISLVSRDTGRNPNLGGPLGQALAQMLESAFGFQAYVLAGLVACLGRPVWSGATLRTLARMAAGGALLLVAFSVAAGLSEIPGMAPGGVAGAAFADALHRWLNFGGGYLVVLLAIVAALALIAGRSPAELASSLAVTTRTRVRHDAEAAQANDFTPSSDQKADSSTSRPTPGTKALAMNRPIDLPAASRLHSTNPSPSWSESNYKLPPLGLLDDPPSEHAKFDEAALQQSAHLLEQKLAGFGVQGQVVEVQPGPVVTMYKVEPGEGVKVSQIVNLADDLSMLALQVR